MLHANGSEQPHPTASDGEVLSLLDGGAGMGSSAAAELQRLRCMLDKERAERRTQQGRANRLCGALVKARAAGAAFAAATVAWVASAAAGAQADAAVAAAEAAAKVQSEARAYDARMRRAAKRTAAAVAAAAAESEQHPECGGGNTSGALLPAAAAACAQWEWEERALVAEERLADAVMQLAALRGAANTMHAACPESSLLAADTGVTTTLTAASVRAQRQNAAEDQPQLLAVGTGSGAPNTAAAGRRKVNVHATSVPSVPTCRSVPQLAMGSNGNGKPPGTRRAVPDGPLLGTALSTSQTPTGRTSASQVQLARKRTQTHHSRQRSRSPSRSTADFFAGSSIRQ